MNLSLGDNAELEFNGIATIYTPTSVILWIYILYNT